MANSEIVDQWIETSLKHAGKPGEAGPLRIVKHNGKHYFVDERCRELRNVEDFSDSIKFKTDGELFSFKMNECTIIT